MSCHAGTGAGSTFPGMEGAASPSSLASLCALRVLIPISFVMFPARGGLIPPCEVPVNAPVCPERFARRGSTRRALLRGSFHRLDLDFPPLGSRHAGPVGRAAHQSARGRAVRYEKHALRDLSLLALKGGLAELAPDADGCAGGNSQGGHIFRIHRQGIDDRLVGGV